MSSFSDDQNDDVNEDLKKLTAQIEGNLNDEEESDTEGLFKTCMNDSDFRDLATTYINDKDLKELVKENLGDANLSDVVSFLYRFYAYMMHYIFCYMCFNLTRNQFSFSSKVYMGSVAVQRNVPYHINIDFVPEM